ncbi:hypothetical protein GOP47_0016641, partial [Adiantum capillus-veneris]
MPAPADAYALLKSSLAETLNAFYPLAGRCRDKSGNGELEIVCNDEGALLQEAWVNCDFESFCLKTDYFPELDLLAPPVDISADVSQASLVLAQLTHFECGRTSLGFRLHHKAMDGFSLDHFLSWWATLSRAKAGEGREGNPSSNGGLAMAMVMDAPPEGLDRSLMKPRKPPLLATEHPEYFAVKQVPTPEEALAAFPPASAAKILRFMPGTIEELRAAAIASSTGCSAAYTRFEIVAALVWRALTYARDLAPTQDVRVGMAVDGRQRFKPPLPQGFFGNVIFYAYAVCDASKLLANPLSFAADLVKASIAKVDDAHMRSALDWLSMQDPGPQVVFPAFARPGLDLAISSWTRFGFYEMDFGWGKPSHLRIPLAYNSISIFLPSSLGPGHIEVF